MEEQIIHPQTEDNPCRRSKETETSTSTPLKRLSGGPPSPVGPSRSHSSTSDTIWQHAGTNVASEHSLKWFWCSVHQTMTFCHFIIIIIYVVWSVNRENINRSVHHDKKCHLLSTVLILTGNTGTSCLLRERTLVTRREPKETSSIDWELSGPR